METTLSQRQRYRAACESAIEAWLNCARVVRAINDSFDARVHSTDEARAAMLAYYGA